MLKFKGMLLSFLQGVFTLINCFCVIFCRILYVKSNYMENTGTYLVILAWDMVLWSSFQLHNDVPVHKFYMHAYENLYLKFNVMKWSGYLTAANICKLIFLDSVLRKNKLFFNLTRMFPPSRFYHYY